MREPVEIEAEVLVIGGGLAGCAAAILLAELGHRVVLVEKEAAPHHKVCGEFLSYESLLYLKRLGIEPERLGAEAIRHVRLTGNKRVTEAALPFPAMSLMRRRLDEELLQRTVASGVTVLRGSAVVSLRREKELWKADLAGSASLTARDVFLATGKHDLRGYARPHRVQGVMIAFKTYWRLTPSQTAEIAQHVELIVYRNGYGGLQPVESGVVNLCCLITAEEYRHLGGGWSHFLQAMRRQSPHLDTRLDGAEPLLERPLAISSIPYGFVRSHTDGLWYLGDQAAVIPSFTGDGMALALHTGSLAAEMYTKGSTAQEFQSRVAGEVRSQVRFAASISRTLIAFPKLSLYASQLWPGALQTIAQQTRLSPRCLAFA